MRTLLAHVVAIALTLVVAWIRPSPGEGIGAAAGAASFTVRYHSDGSAGSIALDGHALFDGARLLAGDRHPGASDGVGPAARFDSPAAVARGRTGELFVADSGNGMVRAIDLASTSVSTLVAGLSYPTALDYDAATETLYVRDRRGIIAIDLRRMNVTTLE